MNRGDIYTAATGSGHGGKPRPVLVVQSSLFANTPNILVALIYTVKGAPAWTRPQLVPDDRNNLEAFSEVALDILVAVPRRKFGYLIGRISQEQQQEVDNLFMLLLGLAG